MGFTTVYGNKYIRIFDYVRTFKTYVIKILFKPAYKIWWPCYPIHQSAHQRII